MNGLHPSHLSSVRVFVGNLEKGRLYNELSLFKVRFQTISNMTTQ